MGKYRVGISLGDININYFSQLLYIFGTISTTLQVFILGSYMYVDWGTVLDAL